MELIEIMIRATVFILCLIFTSIGYGQVQVIDNNPIYPTEQ